MDRRGDQQKVRRAKCCSITDLIVSNTDRSKISSIARVDSGLGQRVPSGTRTGLEELMAEVLCEWQVVGPKTVLRSVAAASALAALQH